MLWHCIAECGRIREIRSRGQAGSSRDEPAEGRQTDGYRRCGNCNEQVSLQSQIGTAVLARQMDTNEALGEQLVELIDAAAMERSVNPAVGAYFDMRV